ncbi:hypothetical protein DFH07DRAFT_1025882 [Mycena maculata]|uniref:Secreted protein n=1 Tax=Mycena maculata TaxID=230809 RepID=A0AAD7K9Y0_9AGAR|nr:hypothetical protein DFH07DRAFT_1025882 [Mycena maculata]
MSTLKLLLNLVFIGSMTMAPHTTSPFIPGFDISAVTANAQSLPTHSWEWGTAAEALLKMNSPLLSVFGSNPFPVLAIPPTKMDFLLNSAPRWSNGTIPQREDVPELWGDFMYMAPPFIAYFAADSNNASLLEIAYLQCGLYREVLLFNSNASTPSPTGTSPTNGLWQHIFGPQSMESGLWSTGNGWAAAGMARVLATSWQANATADLTGGDGHGFGEISGSSLLAAVAYRMVVLAPTAFPAATGEPPITNTAIPAVNPLGPEGNNFVVLMYAAWRLRSR